VAVDRSGTLTSASEGLETRASRTSQQPEFRKLCQGEFESRYYPQYGSLVEGWVGLPTAIRTLNTLDCVESDGLSSREICRAIFVDQFRPFDRLKGGASALHRLAHQKLGAVFGSGAVFSDDYMRMTNDDGIEM
jgi:hypothetical protein